MQTDHISSAQWFYVAGGRIIGQRRSRGSSDINNWDLYTFVPTTDITML